MIRSPRRTPISHATLGLGLLALALTAPAAAQQAEAVPLRGEPPILDGRLDEAVWQDAPAATGFVQREPVQGEPATEATEVRFAYDDQALWIGARMYSADPAAIRAPVTRRDQEADAEQLVVSLDTYRDRRTAYTFAVTPAGVRIDYYHPADREGGRDYGYDPVWQAETARDSLGWTAELRIPLSQLRFNAPATRREQRWGVNLARLVPARNEQSYWVLVGRQETGWASRMGTLTGLAGVRPQRQMELLPYVATDATVSAEVDAGNPFAQRYEAGLRVGGDLKIGLGSGLTLDATVNPDFGQVEADPAEVNLSAYETFFPEKRPFFLEGAELFGGRGLFYSRRIGAAPRLQPEAEHWETVDNTTILGAAKLTGRLPSGLSVGALGAVTDREVVATYDPIGDCETRPERCFGKAVVAPRTGYAVASLRQEFGRDASTVSAMLTGVRRDLEPGGALSDLLGRSAASGLVDTRIRWAGGKYDMSAYFGFTHVQGDTAALLRLQRASSRNWQRPDADYISIDPARRSLGGTMFGINHSKNAGEHWLWDIDYFQESPGLEANDLGAFGSVDDRGLITHLAYRETEPGRLLRNYRLGTVQHTEWNFGGIRRFTLLIPYVNATLPNYWNVALEAVLQPRGISDDLTRGGPLMGTGRGWKVGASLSGNPSSRHPWDLAGGFGADELGGREMRLEGELTLRSNARWRLGLEPRWTLKDVPRQYVMTTSSGRTPTFGQRYVFAQVDRRELAVRARLDYTFTPDLSLQLYAEPFAASGRYHSFGELLAARSLRLLHYGTHGTQLLPAEDGSHTVTADGSEFRIPPRSFSVRSLRSNAVLRWEWRPGSTAYVVWQQDRFGDGTYGAITPGALWDAVEAGGDHFLALKISYWLPVR